MIAHAARGDRAAFDALYETTSARLHAICVAVLKDRPEAEDVLQEIYVAIWQDAGRYQASGLSPMAWLVTIARNRALARLRSRAAGGPALPAEPLAAVSIASPGAASLPGRVEACMSQLSAPEAAALRAVYLEGASYADLAAQSGLAPATLRGVLCRSLLRFGDCIGR